MVRIFKVPKEKRFQVFISPPYLKQQGIVMVTAAFTRENEARPRHELNRPRVETRSSGTDRRMSGAFCEYIGARG